MRVTILKQRVVPLTHLDLTYTLPGFDAVPSDESCPSCALVVYNSDGFIRACPAFRLCIGAYRPDGTEIIFQRRPSTPPAGFSYGPDGEYL